MQFKIINNDMLKEGISNLLMNNYKKSYSDFKKFVKLEVYEHEFEEFKKRKITDKEIADIISRKNIDFVGEIERIRFIWNGKEKKIINEIKEITGINISTNKITCYIDPYQNGGYYGEDHITVGTYKNPEDVLFVISHELFHVFYWRKLAELNLTKSVMGKEKLYEWELAEATVHLLTTDSRMRIFWPTIDIEVYPEIENALNKIKNIWTDYSFKEYLIKSYKLLGS